MCVSIRYSVEEARRARDEAYVLPHVALNTLRHFPFRGCEPIYAAIGQLKPQVRASTLHAYM